jgi:hypothetical protein
MTDAHWLLTYVPIWFASIHCIIFIRSKLLALNKWQYNHTISRAVYQRNMEYFVKLTDKQSFIRFSDLTAVSSTHPKGQLHQRWLT